MASDSAGRPRQVDLRRAISATYYGVFHFCLASVADEFVGITQRQSGRYALLYRSVDHGALKKLCEEARKQTPPAKYVPYIPDDGLGENIRTFATAVVELQEKRNKADYDPQSVFRTSDVKLVIRTARSAVRRFGSATEECRKAFLTLLICPSR